MLPCGLTPLTLAVTGVSREGVGVLLERGVSVDSHGRGGASALQAAVWGGQVQLASRLLSAGASWEQTGDGYNFSSVMMILRRANTL